MFDVPAGGIHGEIEGAGIAVPLPGQNLANPGAAFVDAADISKDFLLRETVGTGLLPLMSHAAFQTGVQICTDTDAERAILLQNDIRIAPDNDTQKRGRCNNRSGPAVLR